MPAAGRGVSIGVRVGSSTYEAVFFIKAKVQISLYSSTAFVYGFQILLQNYFLESRHFGVVNYADCKLIWRLLLERKFLDSKKNTLRDNPYSIIDEQIYPTKKIILVARGCFTEFVYLYSSYSRFCYKIQSSLKKSCFFSKKQS